MTRPEPRAASITAPVVRQAQPTEDEREFDDFAREQDPLDIEAATWVARRRRGLSRQEQKKLNAWLAADARHRAAFGDMEETFGRLRAMSEDNVRMLKTDLSRPRPSSPTDALSSPGRRAWLLGIAPSTLALQALTVSGGAALAWQWWQWRRRPRFEQSFATARGQQNRIELPDGSTLNLDTATRMTVRLYAERREVWLDEGQAFFSVQHDASRPFHVIAGAARVTVLGTRFSTRYTQQGLDAGKTRVAVESGRVRVARLTLQEGIATDASNDVHVELTANQSVLADGQSGVGGIAASTAGSVAAWRDGRVSFDAAPLALALAEFERYGATGVIIHDRAVAAMKVGGSFRSGNFPDFLRAVLLQLPIRLERRDGVTVIVRA